MSDNNATLDKLQVLRTNLERLLRSHNAVLRENDLLKQQIEALRKNVSDKNKRIEALEEQAELQKTAAGLATLASGQPGDEVNADKEEMRKRITDLIKEVDNCISMLNA